MCTVSPDVPQLMDPVTRGVGDEVAGEDQLHAMQRRWDRFGVGLEPDWLSEACTNNIHIISTDDSHFHMDTTSRRPHKLRRVRLCVLIFEKLVGVPGTHGTLCRAILASGRVPVGHHTASEAVGWRAQ